MFPHSSLQRKRKKTINKLLKKKTAALALFNDGLQNRDYENVAMQAQRDVYYAQLQKCQDTIIHLRTSYVDHVRDPGKDNIIIIV